jgi:uncharacterized protein (TIGR03437 family)
MNRLGKLCWVAISIALNAWAQPAAAPVIVTVAGTGEAAYGGDGGPATSAALNRPFAAAVDGAGNLYVCDLQNSRVRMITPGGVIRTVAGTGVEGFGGDGGPAVNAQLTRPEDLAIDAAGNLYIADTVNHRIRKVTPAGLISTVAGSGIGGYSGDAGPATGAQLNSPIGVAVDTVGNLYISDYGNHRIRRLSQGGAITTVAGTGVQGFGGDGGPATAAQLDRPVGVAVDTAGNLYISDYGNHRIRRVRLDGVITTVAGSGVEGFGGDLGPAPAAQLDRPTGITVDRAGNLYIADSWNDSIRKVTPAGVISTVAGRNWSGFSGDGGAATLARLYWPNGVALDASGSLYIAETGNHRIRRVIFSQTGGPLTITTPSPLPTGIAGMFYSASVNAMGGTPPYRWGLSSGNLPPGLSLDSSTGAVSGAPTGTGSFNFTVRVTDSTGSASAKSFASSFGWQASSGLIMTVAGRGGWGYDGDGGPATSARLSPGGLATDSAGNLYICDLLNHRIRKVSRAGVISTVAGTGVAGFSGDGGPASSAQLNNPTGVAVDAQQNLYLADGRNHRIRKIDAAGVISSVAGTGVAGYSGDGGPAISAQLNSPDGVVVDTAGNLYIPDWGNNRVRKVTPAGVITTVAGSGTRGFGGDGGAATSARLDSPADVAVDAAGNLYIADFRNHRIRMVTAAGIISTLVGTGAIGFGGDEGPAGTAQLSYPTGVAVDVAGNLYIADRDNHRIRRVVPGGTISTAAGNGWLGFSGDGGAAISAQLDSPWNVAVDTAGNLYISDGGNDRVRKVTLGQPREPLTITTSSTLPSGTVGTTYSVTLFPSGGVPSYSWSLGSGALPPGLSLEASKGTISGTPTVGGTFSFSLRVSDSAGSTASKSFALTIVAPVLLSPTSLSFAYQAGDPQPAAQLVSVTSSAPGVNFTVSVATTSGGGWLSVSPTSGTTPATLLVSVNPTGLAAGAYSGTVTVTASGAKQTISVELFVNPQISAGGVVNAASLKPGPIAPGEIVTFFGSGLGPVTLTTFQLNEYGQVATALAETQVLFDNIPAPLLYVQASQLSAIVPYAVAGTAQARVQVRYKSATSNMVNVQVAPSAPGIFTIDSSGRGQGAILNQDYSLNTQANPAEKGSVVVAYATGEGETDPQVADGRLASSRELPRPKLLVSVKIGGIEAEVLYAASAPGMVVGLLQVNVRVPPGVASGNAVPVVLTIGGVSSPPGVTMAVR